MSSQSFYTRKGDDGTTGLLGEGRVLKTDSRMEALGALDEASAALGMARSLTQVQGSQEIILQVQRELYQLMAEVAATPENAQRFRVIGEKHINWLEEQTDRLSGQVSMPREFIVPGDTPAGAAFSLTRAIVRRAERRVVQCWQAEQLTNPYLLGYLNRLSSLCFVLELFEVQSAGQKKPTLAKGG